MSEHIINVSNGGIEALHRMQGLYAATRALPGGYDKDELLIDLGEASEEFIGALLGHRPTNRSGLTPAQELRYAVLRAAEQEGVKSTEDLLRNWILALNDSYIQEVIG